MQNAWLNLHNARKKFQIGTKVRILRKDNFVWQQAFGAIGEVEDVMFYKGVITFHVRFLTLVNGVSGKPMESYTFHISELEKINASVENNSKGGIWQNQ